MATQTIKLSNFEKLKQLFEENKNRLFDQWLKFDTVFKKSGKQGIVGLLNVKDLPEEKVVFKLSQYINYLVHHENTVMKSLNELSPYCPHFCRSIGTVIREVNPKAEKVGNPFAITTKHPIEKEILLTEYLDNSCQFYNYIRSSKIKDEHLISIIKQVLMAVTIAQNKKKFTHYDLHSYNVMMKKCNKDVVYLYVLDEFNQFAVPTLGHYPVIIDYGFSYCKDMDGNPCWPSMGHTDVGFMSDRFDWVSDPKLFLVTVSYEMREKRKSKVTRKLRNIVKNIFGNLRIDFESGWDKKDKSAADFVSDILECTSVESNIFDNYNPYCIDIIQSLIILPLQAHSYKDINVSYEAFLKEFVKIEDQIGNPFYNLYILKGIADFAREVRADYQEKDTRQRAVAYFRHSVLHLVDCLVDFFNPKKIHYEKMLCSLLCLARNIEGVLYDVVSTRMAGKQNEYDRMPLQSIEQIYGAIDINLPSKYTYNENTVVFVMNCITEEKDRMVLTPEMCDEVNGLQSFEIGSFLYETYKNLVN